LVNVVKQQMLAFLTLSYAEEAKKDRINEYRDTARRLLPEVTILVEQIERALTRISHS